MIFVSQREGCVDGEAPPLNVDPVELADDAEIADHHHGPGHHEDRDQQVDLVGLEEPGSVPVRDAVELAAVLHGQMDPGHGSGQSQAGGEQPHQHRHLLGLGGGAEVLGPHRVNHSVVSR